MFRSEATSIKRASLAVLLASSLISGSSTFAQSPAPGPTRPAKTPTTAAPPATAAPTAKAPAAPAAAIKPVAGPAGNATAAKHAPLPSPPAAPTTVATCLGMLNDIGPHYRMSKLSAPNKAALQVKGATIADHCHQSRFKEAFAEHGRLIAALDGLRK